MDRGSRGQIIVAILEQIPIRRRKGGRGLFSQICRDTQ